MFNLAIDSKLRGCDVVAIRAEVTQPWPSTNLQKHPPLAPVLIAARAVASTLPTPCLMVGIAAGNPAQKSYTGNVPCLRLTLAGLRRPKMGFHSRNRQPQEAASAREIRHRNPSLLNL